MSEHNPFNSFIDLIDFDQKIYAHELKIEKHEQELSHLAAQKLEMADRLKIAKNTLHDTKKLVDEKELEMQVLESKEANKKKCMDQVTNNKEYQSIKHELDAIDAQRIDLEEVLISSWNRLEMVQKKYDLQEKEQFQKIKDIDIKIIKEHDLLKELHNALDELRLVRSTKESMVPAEWLEKYMIMRTQVSDPVVPVVDGNCSSCFHRVTGQDFIYISKNRLLQCKGCYRFLYIESSERRVKEQ